MRVSARKLLVSSVCVVLIGLGVVLGTSGVDASVRLGTLEGVAYRVVVEGDGVEAGGIVSLVDGRYILSNVEYDSRMSGVLIENPKIEVDLIGEGALPMVDTGHVAMKVVAKNGEIAIGDWITSSDIPGVGMKATRSGIVVGEALEAFAPGNDTQIGVIPVAVNIHPNIITYGGSGLKLSDEARESFFDLLGVFRTAATVEAPQAFRYVLAAFLVLVTILFGFFTFGRMAQSGIEAIGRNPLAKQTILVGLVINVVVSVVIIFAGLVSAYYVIRL